VKARIFAEENKKWWTLAAVSFGLFMIMLDNTIVNVALPTIQSSLHLKVSELEWVVTGYALTFGALMLTGGKLADLFGRRLIFVVGLVIFTFSSLACGLAGSATVLIAIGIWAGVSAMALAIGPLVGGLITEHINWNWIFYINVPIGALAIAAAYAFIEESRDTSHEQRPDVPGLFTSALSLFTLSYALIEANTYGWTSGRIVAAFAVAAVAMVAFVLLEMHQRLPMLELGLFRNRGFAGANSVMLLVGLAMFGVFFYVSLYVQQILGYSPVQAGASFLPWTLLIILLAPQAGRLSDRYGPRPFVTSGMIIVAGSLFLFSRLGAHETFWHLLPAMLLGGVGMSAAMAPTTAAAMASVRPDKAGVGSAVLNSMRQVGGSLGIAIMGAIVASGISSSLAAGHSRVDAFVSGYQHATVVAALIAVVGAIVAATTLQHARHREPAAEPAFPETA